MVKKSKYFVLIGAYHVRVDNISNEQYVGSLIEQSDGMMYCTTMTIEEVRKSYGHLLTPKQLNELDLQRKTFN